MGEDTDTTKLTTHKKSVLHSSLAPLDLERVCRILVRLAIQTEDISNEQTAPLSTTKNETSTADSMDTHRATT